MTAGAAAEGTGIWFDGERVIWQLFGEPPQETRIWLHDNQIQLRAEADTGGGIAVLVEAQRPFELEIDTGFTTFVEQVPGGQTRYLLTYLDRTDVRRV